MGLAKLSLLPCQLLRIGRSGRLVRTHAGSLICAVAMVMALFEGVFGQARIIIRNQPGTRFNNQVARQAASAIIQPSEEASNLLRRADEGIERGDWKLVIDSLQRIVELPGEHVLTSDNLIYESARRHAHRRIATLPPEGLQAYRLVHDGEAGALLAKGIEKYDQALLRTVVDKYICTHSGDDAALTLADWLMDEGRFSEAASLLHQIQAIYPDSEIPDWVVLARLSVCSAALGQRERAQGLLKSAVETQPAELTSGSTSTAPAAANVLKVPATIEADRVKEISAYIESASRADGREKIASWPLVFGSPARDGKLPAVEPAFIDYPPWVEDLMSGEGKLGVDIIRDYAQRQKHLPVRHVVTDGKVLVVKGDSDLLAFDVDSFSQVWTSKKRRDELAINPNPNPMHPQNFNFTNQNDAQLRNDPQVVRMLHDSVGADVNIAYGLALTVEWPGDPPAALMEHPAHRSQGRDTYSAPHPNRIAAYSLEDGSLVWQNETTARPPDRQNPNMQNVPPQTQNEIEFLAAPIPVEGFLLAPCRINGDLFAALLDPKTGKLVRQIYLCGTGGGLFDSLYALRPCVADGAVFIPTGRGLLVAVQTSDWSVRWAVRYETLPETTTSGGWLPSPVIAVADVVLLAPGDSDFIFCIDRGTGELRWKAPRENSLYLVGANDTHVWSAGPRLEMREIERGGLAWQIEVGEPTGRGSIIGNRIYLPIINGVKVVNASSGQDIPMPEPVVPPSLGNIFAWEGSVYSVSIDKLRKYPDLGEGYQQAVVRHQSNPSDASRAIRLACLELLKNQPTKALAALSSVPDLSDSNKRQHTHVVHLRVRSMLDMVSSGEVDSQAALKLLSDARTIAQSREDAIESSLALGDFLRRQEKFLEASLQYLTLVLSEEGEQMIASEAGLQHRARGVAVQRIAAMSKNLQPSDKTAMETRIREWMDKAIAQQDEQSLMWLAESAGLSEQVHEAELILGNWAVADMRSEQAEGYYLRAMRGAKMPALVAEATARLAALSLEADELHQPISAQKLLDRLQNELANVPVPEAAIDIDSTSDKPTNESNRKTVPAARLAESLKNRLDQKILDAHQAVMKPVVLGQIGKAIPLQIPYSRPLNVRGDRIEPLCDKMLLLVDNNSETHRVEAHDLEDVKMIWPAELRLLGDLAVESRQPSIPMGNQSSARSDVLGRGRCVADGQTMIVNSPFGVHAIGMLTGRRLWSRPFDPPSVGSGVQTDPSGSDAWIWVNNGYLVSVDSRWHLDVAYVNQGDRILWRRSKPERRWAAVRSRGPYVVAVDAGLQQVDVYMLNDGRYLGECKFQQDPSPLRQVNISLYDDVICGPVEAQKIAALNLDAPGIERWSLKTPDVIAQVFKPRPDRLAVADRSGGLQVVDPATGKVLMQTRVPQCANGVNDGALIDGILYVYGYQNRVTDTNEFEKQQWAMAAIRMDNGEVLWQVKDLPARTYFSDEMLRGSSNTIPVATFLIPTDPKAQAARIDSGNMQVGAIELAMYDKATGKEIGDKVVTALNNEPGATRILDVSIWPDRVTVVAGTTFMFFPAPKSPAGVSSSSGAPGKIRNIWRPMSSPMARTGLSLKALFDLGNPLPLQSGAQALSDLRDAFMESFDDAESEEPVEEVVDEK